MLGIYSEYLSRFVVLELEIMYLSADPCTHVKHAAVALNQGQSGRRQHLPHSTPPPALSCLNAINQGAV